MVKGRSKSLWAHRLRVVTVGWLAMLILTGGPWAMLQALAWSRMLVVYSQDSSPYQAIIKTFDGRNPCRMCKSISEARAEKQRKDPTHASNINVESFWVATVPMWEWTNPVAPSSLRSLDDWVGEGIFHAPPVPPPRTLNAVS